MGRAKNGFIKTKSGFSFWGDISECIKVAERKIERLKKDTAYIARRHEEEERRYKAHFTAINNAEHFISLAKGELERRKQEERQCETEKR